MPYPGGNCFPPYPSVSGLHPTHEGAHKTERLLTAGGKMYRLYLRPSAHPHYSDTVVRNSRFKPFLPVTAVSKETGQSISSYICEQKINTARNMLLFSSYSSAEIAAILAFPSQSYFSGTFKKKTGMTPSDYRLHGRRREETLL